MLKQKQVRELEKTHKIPCSSDRYFIITLDIESAMPTKKELEMLKSYREYIVRRLYNKASAILDMKLPAESGHNTTSFLKGDYWSSNGKRGWCYSRISWRQGPTFFPTEDTAKPFPPPWTLLQVLDHINEMNNKPFAPWETWKKVHEKIFR